MGLLTNLKRSLGFWPPKGEAAPGKGASWDKSQRGVSLRLVVLGLMGLVIFLAAGFFGQGGKKVPDDPASLIPEGAIKVDNPLGEEGPMTLREYEEELSSRLAQVLTQVEGAGEVLLYVSLMSGPEYDYARNQWVESRITEEKDTGGGQRVIEEMREENQLVMAASTQGTRDEGLVQRELQAPVKGVLIVAEGAGNPRVKAELIRAAQVVLGVGSHQVLVLPKER